MSRNKRTRHALELRESSYASAEELHGELAAMLEFPDHYGQNLDALNDCLGDVSRPTRIVAVRDGSSEWFGRFCAVFVRAALENPELEVQIEDERE